MRVRVKICGITNVADALLAAELGTDAIGLNFYADSARVIAMDLAGEIIRTLPPFVEPVALFVNDTIAQIEATAIALSVNTVQIHGAIPGPAPFVFGDLQFIAAFPVKDATELQWIQAYSEDARKTESQLAAILVDAHVPGQFGGTGQVAPWHLLADFKPGVPLILAGGLTPENVTEAIRIVRPYAVDVASGVESSPGKKDSEKMRRFIDAVRTASESL